MIVELEHSATETDKEDEEGLGRVNVVGLEVRLELLRNIGAFIGMLDDCAPAFGSGNTRHEIRSQSESGNVPLRILYEVP